MILGGGPQLLCSARSRFEACATYWPFTRAERFERGLASAKQSKVVGERFCRSAHMWADWSKRSQRGWSRTRGRRFKSCQPDRKTASDLQVCSSGERRDSKRRSRIGPLLVVYSSRSSSRSASARLPTCWLAFRRADLRLERRSRPLHDGPGDLTQGVWSPGSNRCWRQAQG